MKRRGTFGRKICIIRCGANRVKERKRSGDDEKKRPTTRQNTSLSTTTNVEATKIEGGGGVDGGAGDWRGQSICGVRVTPNDTTNGESTLLNGCKGPVCAGLYALGGADCGWYCVQGCF